MRMSIVRARGVHSLGWGGGKVYTLKRGGKVGGGMSGLVAK